jgi:polyribonucleotide nucleotidyltransferase
MSEFHRVERQIGEKILSIETGRLARQADGAAVVQYGDTIVLVAAVTAPPRSEEIDFFPLSVDYREKTSAAGKFPGGFIKREGRPSTKETLTARMIDRPIRPLFPEGYVQEVQIIANVLSADQQNDPDILAMIGASAALSISKIPFLGPIASCRMGRKDGQFVINPTHQQLAESDLNLILGGHKESINMIEVSARQLPEQVIADAVAVGHKAVIEVCQMIEELTGKLNVQKECPLIEVPSELYSEINSQIADKLYELKQIPEKQERNTAVKELFEGLVGQYCPDDRPVDEAQCTLAVLKQAFQKIEKEIVRKLILQCKRPDGRGYKDVRPISCDVGILPRTHGSALFTRGQTQSLVTATLGTIRDAQLIEGLIEGYDQKFMLHYNFPPFSVGEVRPVRGPGRREIGHGALAERALEQVRPGIEEFPYTVRLVADILESNGSSSMATVCSGSLALMDAGIPIEKPVAGISIGMVRDGDRCELLMDITGEEDHFGEMDFKVAGTTDGITAIQLDVKAEGLPGDIMVRALELAKQGRLQILEIMAKTIDQARPNISEYAPKMTTLEIDPELIGKVIGPGGKMVKSIQEQTGATVEIEDDGTIYISCFGGDGHLKAKEMIEDLTQPPQVGKIYPNAKVVSVKDFGVFVEITPGVEGLCHISELSEGYVRNIEEICKVGDTIPVKLLSIDDQGRSRLSRRAALAEQASTSEAADFGKTGYRSEK